MFSKFRSLIFKIDPETAHNLAIKSLKLNILPNITDQNKGDPIFETNLFSKNIDNPIGMAAGFDKNAEVYNSLFKLGFGFVEVGTVTPLEQYGNPKPRVFRLVEDQALINRLGFNNLGAENVSNRIKSNSNKGLLGVNIGPNKDSEDRLNDYLIGLRKFYDIADYITVNISSPNTPNLRELHGKSVITPFLENLIKASQTCAKKHNIEMVPLLLKISPDENYKSLEHIVCSARDIGFSGVIATNTSVSRLKTPTLESFESGGLSGNPIEAKSVQVIKFLAKLTDYRFPIIGVGGISSVDTAIRKLDAGASLLQIYSSLIYQGPFFPASLNKSLSHRSKFWI